MLPFKQLLERAELGSHGPALELAPQQRADIVKLNEFRGDLEHVKPVAIEVAGLPRICASATVAFAALLKSFQHRLEEDEVERTKAAIATLSGQQPQRRSAFRAQAHRARCR